MVYGVTVPFRGTISVTVEARTEDEAVEKALEIANLDGMDGCSIDDCIFEDDVDIEYVDAN